jgi:hypothetical protein
VIYWTLQRIPQQHLTVFAPLWAGRLVLLASQLCQPANFWVSISIYLLEVLHAFDQISPLDSCVLRLGLHHLACCNCLAGREFRIALLLLLLHEIAAAVSTSFVLPWLVSLLRLLCLVFFVVELRLLHRMAGSERSWRQLAVALLEFLACMSTPRLEHIGRL